MRHQVGNQGEGVSGKDKSQTPSAWHLLHMATEQPNRLHRRWCRPASLASNKEAVSRATACLLVLAKSSRGEPTSRGRLGRSGVRRHRSTQNTQVQRRTETRRIRRAEANL